MPDMHGVTSDIEDLFGEPTNESCLGIARRIVGALGKALECDLHDTDIEEAIEVACQRAEEIGVFSVARMMGIDPAALGDVHSDWAHQWDDAKGVHTGEPLSPFEMEQRLQEAVGARAKRGE